MEPVSSTPATQTTNHVPSGEWPGAFGIFKHSKNAVVSVIAVLIVWWLVTVVVNVLFQKHGWEGQIASGIIGCLASAGMALAYIAGVRGQQPSIGENVKKAFSLWLKMILLTILLVVVLIGSLLLLIIPFFFVLPRVVLAEYFLVDKNMGVVESLKASWNATDGNSMKVWGIIGATFVMVLPAFTIIGIPVAIVLLVLYGAAFAVLYDYLGKSQPAAAAADQQ